MLKRTYEGKTVPIVGKEVEPSNDLFPFGSVASGDLVMRSGRHRYENAIRHLVIAFEMEGAGVWDIIATIVIKNICR